MTAPARHLAVAGAVLAGLAVALGAFGAHALRTSLSSNDLAIFETGVRYQMYHALGTLFAAWRTSHAPDSSARLAGWLFVIGSLVFSGSLYLLVLTGARWLGAITPIGGGAFLVGWLALAAAFRRPPGGKFEVGSSKFEV